MFEDQSFGGQSENSYSQLGIKKSDMSYCECLFTHGFTSMFAHDISWVFPQAFRVLQLLSHEPSKFSKTHDEKS